jgi:hypothetical protein
MATSIAIQGEAMADDETKQKTPETTDEDADQEDVEGHSHTATQRPDRESSAPKKNEAEVNEAQNNSF